MKLLGVLLLAALVCASSARQLSLFDILRGVPDESNIWVLLVAGSNTWDNYRHQADVCHAYQIFHSHGVPDDHIVVMMYNDLAKNEMNPTPGVIINHLNGPNVYTGVPHDYVKEDVTPENFLKILQGKDMSGTGSGKTIKSGPNDYVFVNFVDHGAPGLVAFPDGELTAKQLNKAIENMHAANQYNQMVVYVEACESGSMFDGILKDSINVYATTAANPNESSYAVYYDSKLETYLGDVYSVKWMENVDKVGTATETLEEQYKIVKRETTTSHVMQYGDLAIDKKDLEVFMGSKNKRTLAVRPSSMDDAVPSGDVRLSILTRKIFSMTNEWDKRATEKQLMEELMLRDRVRLTVEDIVRTCVTDDTVVNAVLGNPAHPMDYDCLEAVVGSFSQKCFKLGQVDYALRHVYALINLCETGIPSATIIKAMDSAC